MSERPSSSQPKWLAVLFSFVHVVGLTGFVVAEIVQRAQHGSTGFVEASLLNAIVWLIGVNGIVAGSGHLVFPDAVADSIGWPHGTPWQWEVGLAGLSWGVLGVIAPTFERPFWLATIIVASIFLFGAAIGHVRQLAASHNRSPGNAGAILYTDILIPLIVIALYAAT